MPSDHLAGTFWYHPHLNGSTALQVSSGMAGFLIVRGDRPPTPQLAGDIDTLLKEPGGAAFAQRLVLLQQIQYACRDADGKIQKDSAGKYICNTGQKGGIEGYDQFGPGSWPKSGRYTTINGEVTPLFASAQAGRVERWRILHAGVRDSVLLQFRKMRPDAANFALLTAERQADWVAQNCPGAPLPQFALASDGITRGQIMQRATTVLQPGYREDLLVVFPEAADYCVIDDGAGPDSTINEQARSRKFLDRVNVGVGQAVKSDDIKAYLQKELIAAADRTMPETVKKKVLDDLVNDLRLSSFVPHPDIAENEVTGKQTLQFKIDNGGPETKFEDDGTPYNPDHIDRTPTLGGVDEWTLTSWNNPQLTYVPHPRQPVPGGENPRPEPQRRQPQRRDRRPSIRQLEKHLEGHAAGHGKLPDHYTHPLSALHRRVRPALPYPRSRGPGNHAKHLHRDSGRFRWRHGSASLKPLKRRTP